MAKKILAYDIGTGNHLVPSEGDVVYSGNLVSTDRNNNLIVGSDGGLYINKGIPHDRGTIFINPTAAEPVTTVTLSKGDPSTPYPFYDLIFQHNAKLHLDVTTIQDALGTSGSNATLHIIFRKGSITGDSSITSTSIMFVNGKKISVGEAAVLGFPVQAQLATVLISASSMFMFY